MGERGVSLADFRRIVDLLGEQGRQDIEWAEALRLPTDAIDFATEAIFVICNSGMKNTVARRIFDKMAPVLTRGGSASEVFGHKGKSAAIDRIWREQESLFATFLAAHDKLTWLETLPWIGGITKYHLAKNFGVDCAKPDVHLQRLADRAGTDVHTLCATLAAATGYRIATVDTLLWRACANGIVDSRTGRIATESPT